jgi:hypothetical protein
MKRRGFLQALAGGFAALTGVSGVVTKKEDFLEGGVWPETISVDAVKHRMDEESSTPRTLLTPNFFELLDVDQKELFFKSFTDVGFNRS